MNRVVKAVAVIGTVGLVGPAHAANPATFNITANMGGTLSVAIVSGAPVALGALAPSAVVNNTAAVVVRNDSAGFVEDYELSVGNSAGGWSIAAAQGVNQATLHVQFNATVPGNTIGGAGNFQTDDQLIGAAAPILAGNTAGGGAFAGNQDGQDVAPGEDNNLWIRFGAPTADTTGGAPQSFTVTINAVNP
jgi:hypothetical protein